MYCLNFCVFIISPSVGMVRVILCFYFVFYLPRPISSFLFLPLLPFSELVKTNQFDILGRSK